MSACLTISSYVHITYDKVSFIGDLLMHCVPDQCSTRPLTSWVPVLTPGLHKGRVCPVDSTHFGSKALVMKSLESFVGE